MSSQKTLLIPWLMSKIGNPDYPGLKWLNPEQTHFRIPWKHGSRSDRCDDDIKIFKEWAIENHRYRPGIDKSQPKEWKTNLRAALHRKSEVEMTEDHSSDSSDPHKVYRFIGQFSGAGQESNKESQKPVDGVCPNCGSPYLEQVQCDRFNLGSVLQALQPLTNRLPVTVESYPELSVQEPAPPLQEPAPLEINPLEQLVYQSFPNNTLVELQEPAPPFQEPAPPFQEPAPPLQDPAPPLQEPAPQEISPLEQFLRQFVPNGTLVTDFDVEVYYRGKLVLNKLVQNPRGMRFTSSTAPGTRPDLEDIVLPVPSMLSDQEVARMINKVLHSLVPGLLLEVQGGAISGIRDGNCRAFWTMTEFPPTNEVKEVQKNEYTQMYTLQQFVSELIRFMQRTRRDSPQYSIWLCLGDFWPDRQQKPWTKKFIMVKITPVVFRLLHEIIHSTGASSLSSSEMNLQISDPLTSENWLDFLQDLEERMETEFGC